LETCRLKLLDRSLEETSKKETRHDSLPGNPVALLDLQRRRRRRRGSREMTRTN